MEVGFSHDFHDIESKMRKLGFKPDTVSGIRCRWVVVALMPTDEAILGFSNRWYSDAIVHAVDEILPDGQRIRCVTAPYFIVKVPGLTFGCLNLGAGNRPSHLLFCLVK